jgi:hypothetical protein
MVVGKSQAMEEENHLISYDVQKLSNLGYAMMDMTIS